jgi:hypothetical protein
MALSQVFDHPHRSPQRLSALAELDTTDIVLVVAVIVEEHRSRYRIVRRDELARELSEVIIGADTPAMTHHVAHVAEQHDALGHLAVQYAQMTLGTDVSFSQAVKDPDEHLRILAGQYALQMANTPSTWNGPNPWSADSMISLLPLLDDEQALFKLVTQPRINLSSASLARYVEVVDVEALEWVMLHVPLHVLDSVWAAAASLMGEKARAELAFRDRFSFVRRRAMQSTLPTEMLLAKLDKVNENVRSDIETVLASREQ